MNKSGFTLIEVIISMLVIAIVMYALIAIFINTGFKGADIDAFTVAQSLAEGKIEESMAKSFGSISSEVETSFSADLSNYTYEIVVNYVSPEALDVPAGSITDYKKVTILIRHPQLQGVASLESIRTVY